jgi:hypothetical protein
METDMKYMVLYWDEYNEEWCIYTWQKNIKRATAGYSRCRKHHKIVKLVEVTTLREQEHWDVT